MGVVYAARDPGLDRKVAIKDREGARSVAIHDTTFSLLVRDGEIALCTYTRRVDAAFIHAELAQVGALLVDERVIRRVIDGHLELYRVGQQVPHDHCYSVPRAILERYVGPSELGAGAPSLPDHVALVTGDRAALAALVPAAWSTMWRTVFHVQVHRWLEDRRAHGELTIATVRQRIDEIGQAEFDEARAVLRHDDLLLPPEDDVATYIELAALYLELRTFAPQLLAPTFPALRDLARLDATIAHDVDASSLLATSRPASAPEQPLVASAPVTAPIDAAAPDAPVEPRAARRAAKARGRGNRARAAIFAARSGDLGIAREDLEELVTRLAAALGIAAPAGWAAALLPVVQVAASRGSPRFSDGARLLHDLQSACVVAEREAKVVDVFRWARTRGQTSLVRSLPATREVRVARYIRAAVARVDRCGVPSSADHRQLGEALQEMAAAADASIRAVVRPKIESVLRSVGLQPQGVAEQLSEKRLVDELLDRAVAIGRLSLGDLRDAISRNDLKMDDVGLEELRKGDALLRCDRILSVSLDGVHRRGEVYLRGLQKLSSVLFGTPLGRLLTLYVLLPALGAFAVLEGLQHMIAPFSTRLFDLEPELATPTLLAVGAGVLFLVLHVPFIRRVLGLTLRALWRVVRFPLIDVPRAIWRHALVRRVVTSPVVRWGVRPAFPALVVAALLHGRTRWPITIAVYLVLAVITNLRAWRRLEERIAEAIALSTRQLAATILPGLAKSILAVFARLLDVFERALYRVDEWLRFRSGQSIVVVVVKGVFGTIWAIVAYLLRVYINLFLEPTVNPIKHFPVVTVAAKILLPLTPAIIGGIAGPSVRLLGPTAGNAFAVLTDFFLPGLAGFLVWELKENWKLYRKTRHKHVRPVAIGHHGESLAGLLVPGFHSGTVPKHFAKLRRAAWRGDEHAVIVQHEEIDHVQHAIATFVDRQLVAMLRDAPGFVPDESIASSTVVGSNRVEIALACPGLGAEPVVIRIEHQAGWLLAGLYRRGWLDHVGDHRRFVFETALCGFYKLCGVGLVREQIDAALGTGTPAVPAYHVRDDALRVWPRDRFDVEIAYSLRSNRLKPKIDGAAYDGAVPALAGRKAVFRRQPLRWSAWVTAWQRIALGEQVPPLVPGPSLLGAAPRAP